MSDKKLNNNSIFSISDVSGTQNKYFKKLNRKKIYWTSQISGWSLFVIINLIFISSFQELSVKRVLLLLMLGLAGLVFSHLYRNYIKKRNWAHLPLKNLIFRVIVASFLVALLIYIPTFVTGQIMQIEREENNLVAYAAAGILNITSIIIIWSLIYFSIHFFENSQKSEIESLIFEAAVKDFELKTLKAQLNPHFMFNAMNSIRALIEEDPQNAKDAITKLSNLMRYTLKIERTEAVPLSEELKTTLDYLDLEKIRFEERLNYKITSTPSADRIEIPPMMVQTLVENGIKHGISKNTSGGKIEVNANVVDKYLVIEIFNTGNFNEDSLKNSRGFGISNTKHRLSLLYGESASLSLTNENNNTVKTTLNIPIGGSKL